MLSINDIVEALRNNDPSTAFYYDRSTDSIVSIYAPKGIPSLYEERADQFVPLPELYEDDEAEIIDRFIQTLDLEPAILIALSASTISFQEIVDKDPELNHQWSVFYTQALASIARRWCDENDIEYMQHVSIEDAPVDSEMFNSILADFLTEDEGDEDSTPPTIVKLKIPDNPGEYINHLIEEGGIDEAAREDMDEVSGGTEKDGCFSHSQMMAIGLVQAIKHLHRVLDADAFEAVLNDIQEKIAGIQ